MRHLLPLALLALVPILLAPAGSAKPTPVLNFRICVQTTASSPSCGGATASSFTGDTASTIQLSVTNDATSTLSLGSADVTVPDQLKVEQGTALPSKYVSTDGQHIKFQGLNLQGGKSFTATFTADVACGGQALWSSLTQYAYTSSDLSGTPSTNYSNTATATTNIVTQCHLAFVNQPTDTLPGSTILDQGATTGDPVTVGLFRENGTAMDRCPVGYSTCSVKVDRTPADSSNDSITGTTTQQLDSTLVASFGDLSIASSTLPKQFRLTATGVGSFAPTVNSASFLIANDVEHVPCDVNGHCFLNGKKLDTSGFAFADLTGVSGFTFMTLSPYTLGNYVPRGCENRIYLGVGGFAESDGRAPGSSLTIRYYVDNDVIKARYGKNVGAQFLPICAGGRAVDPTTHTAVDCTEPGNNLNGWVGQKLTSKGAFAGVNQNAYCDSDGYYWGILSSYQDKIPTGNPVVTNWGGQNINGKNYRFFDITVPPEWDWRSGP